MSRKRCLKIQRDDMLLIKLISVSSVFSWTVLERVFIAPGSRYNVKHPLHYCNLYDDCSCLD
jgi:hypothetical protein